MAKATRAKTAAKLVKPLLDMVGYTYPITEVERMVRATSEADLDQFFDRLDQFLITELEQTFMTEACSHCNRRIRTDG